MSEKLSPVSDANVFSPYSTYTVLDPTTTKTWRRQVSEWWRDGDFVRDFCGHLLELLQDVKENWSNPKVLINVINIARTCFEHCEIGHRASQAAPIALLREVRAVAKNWMDRLVAASARCGRDDSEMQKIRTKIVEVAVMGTLTFAPDLPDNSAVVARSDETSLLHSSEDLLLWLFFRSKLADYVKDQFFREPGALRSALAYSEIVADSVSPKVHEIVAGYRSERSAGSSLASGGRGPFPGGSRHPLEDTLGDIHEDDSSRAETAEILTAFARGYWSELPGTPAVLQEMEWRRYDPRSDPKTAKMLKEKFVTGVTKKPFPGETASKKKEQTGKTAEQEESSRISPSGGGDAGAGSAGAGRPPAIATAASTAGGPPPPTTTKEEDPYQPRMFLAPNSDCNVFWKKVSGNSMNSNQKFDDKLYQAKKDLSCRVLEWTQDQKWARDYYTRYWYEVKKGSFREDFRFDDPEKARWAEVKRRETEREKLLKAVAGGGKDLLGGAGEDERGTNYWGWDQFRKGKWGDGEGAAELDGWGVAGVSGGKAAKKSGGLGFWGSDSDSDDEGEIEKDCPWKFEKNTKIKGISRELKKTAQNYQINYLYDEVESVGHTGPG